LPPNIQNLYLTGTQLSGPNNLNFAVLLSPLSPDESFAGRLAQSLSGRFPGYIVNGEPRPNASDSIKRAIPWTTLLLFLPLTFWFVWFALRKKSRSGVVGRPAPSAGDR
jgi:hypothetical protein